MLPSAGRLISLCRRSVASHHIAYSMDYSKTPSAPVLTYVTDLAIHYDSCFIRINKSTLNEKMPAAKVRLIAITAAIMHNMTVEIRRAGYTSDGGGGVFRLYDESTDTVGMVLESLDESEIGGTLNRAYVADDIKLPRYYRQLKDAHINLMWASHGEIVGSQ